MKIQKSTKFSHFQFQLCHQGVFLKYDSFFIYGQFFKKKKKKSTYRFLKNGLVTKLSSKTFRESSFLAHTEQVSLSDNSITIKPSRLYRVTRVPAQTRYDGWIVTDLRRIQPTLIIFLVYLAGLTSWGGGCGEKKLRSQLVPKN